jgi:hypothetical protein
VLVAAVAGLLSGNAAAAPLERVLVFSKDFTVAVPFAGK